MARRKIRSSGDDAAQLEALRAEIALGIADLDAGRYVVVKDHELEDYLRRLGRRRP